LLLVLAACTGGDRVTDVGTRPLDVYLIAGQSNAVGGASSLDLSAGNAWYATPYDLLYAQERECPTDFLGGPAQVSTGWGSQVGPYGNAMGIELSAGRRLLERFGTNIALLKEATSGTNLNQYWEPDTDNSLWEYMTTYIDARLAELPAGSRVAGVFWIHGEGDSASDSVARGYYGALAWFITRFRQEYGPVPFVINELCPADVLTSPDITRERQRRVAQFVPGVALAPTDDLALRDGVQHYDADSFITLGNRMADLMPARYADSGTTWERIRAQQVTTLRAVVPRKLAGLGRFRPWDPVAEGGGGFVAWADQAIDPLRRFEIVHGLDYQDEKYLDQNTDLVRHSETVLVAYPKLIDGYGVRIETLIDWDINDIRAAIGERGYADYDRLGTGLHAARLVATNIDERPACFVLRLVFELEYDRGFDMAIPPANEPPTADFSLDSHGLGITCTDLSTDPDGTIVSWAWDFGDGGTDTAQNPNHTYAADGTYSVTLTATDSGGARSSKTRSVTVAAVPRTPITIIGKLADGSSTADGTTFVTAAITPTANDLVLIWVESNHNTAAEAPTVTGAGLTWVQVDTLPATNPTRRITLLRARGGSPIMGALTITHATSHTSCCWAVAAYRDIDPSGTNGSGAIQQIKKTVTAAALGASHTLAAFENAFNVHAYGVATAANQSDVTPATGFTERSDVMVTLSNASLETADAVNALTANPTWGTSALSLLLSIEIKAA
jgi:hypothetical protein